MARAELDLSALRDVPLAALVCATSSDSLQGRTPAEFARICAEADRRRAEHRARLLAGQASDLGPQTPDAPRPLTSWREVARAVGVSTTTLRRARHARQDRTAPWFENSGAARHWYASLLAPPPTRKPGRNRAPKSGAPEAVTDWQEVRRDVTRR